MRFLCYIYSAVQYLYNINFCVMTREERMISELSSFRWKAKALSYCTYSSYALLACFSCVVNMHACIAHACKIYNLYVQYYSRTSTIILYYGTVAETHHDLSLIHI